MVSPNTVAPLMHQMGRAAPSASAPQARPPAGADGEQRSWSGVTLPRIGSTASGSATAPEIPTVEGKLNLDSVLDMGSRRIVGFALGEHHDTKLAPAALQMAVAVRGGKGALATVIMHTDRAATTPPRTSRPPVLA